MSNNRAHDLASLADKLCKYTAWQFNGVRFNTHATALWLAASKRPYRANFCGLDYQTLFSLFRQRGLKCWRGQGLGICRGIKCKKAADWAAAFRNVAER
ncbi:hypothetical protein BZG11_13750 [Salinivibrio kushneri]|nr:hypothetical protein BZG11_13750 [Salinivibrio kushneri]